MNKNAVENLLPTIQSGPLAIFLKARTGFFDPVTKKLHSFRISNYFMDYTVIISCLNVEKKTTTHLNDNPFQPCTFVAFPYITAGTQRAMKTLHKTFLSAHYLQIWVSLMRKGWLDPAPC